MALTTHTYALAALPVLSNLVTTHRAEIAVLRAALDNVLTPAHDNIWLLRFLLSSNMDTFKAEVRAREAIKYRRLHRDVLAFAASSTPFPNEVKLSQLLVQDVRVVNGTPRLLVYGGRSKLRELHETFTDQQVVDYILYTKERCHVIADAESRRTDRLVKMVTLIDLDGLSWFGFDRRFLRCISTADAMSEPCYPQLLGLATIVNAPIFVNVLWSIAQKIMPAATCEKVSFAPSKEVLELL